MRPLASLVAVLLAAAPTASVLAAPAVPMPTIEPAVLDPWAGSLYADFGLDLFYPLRSKPIANRAVTKSLGWDVRMLTVDVALGGGGTLRAVVLEFPADHPRLDPDETVRGELEDFQVVGLHEVKANVGRAWEYDSLDNGRHVHNRMVIMPRREYLLQAISNTAGAFEPGAARFLHSALILP